MAWANCPPLDNLVFLFAGILIGWVFGIFPGLGPINAMALMLPLTFGWDPTKAMYLFAGLVGSGGQGGSITSIVLNIPGSAQNAATCFDGYPLARQGRAAWALGISASASMLGALFGVAVLLVVIPLILPILLAFGPAEKLWIVIFGLVALALALQGSMIKGLAAGIFGILLTFIGIGGSQLAAARFNMGSIYLLDGLSLVAILIGFLVGSEAIGYMVDGITRKSSGNQGASGALVAGGAKLADMKEALKGMLVPFRYPVTLLRSSGIGTLIGIIPGVGGVVARSSWPMTPRCSAPVTRRRSEKASRRVWSPRTAPSTARRVGRCCPRSPSGCRATERWPFFWGR